MLNNEIFLSDPIGWMQDDSEFIVMTAVSGRSRRNEYGKVALCEVAKGCSAQDDQRAGQGHAVHLGAS